MAVFGNKTGLKVIYGTPLWDSALSHTSTASLLIQQFCEGGIVFPTFQMKKLRLRKGLHDICYQKFETDKVSVTSCPLEVMH